MASGVKVHAGQKGLIYEGAGQIYFKKAARRGIDSHLFACLKIAVDQTKLAVEVNSVDTGGYVVGSRHWDGRAVDIHIVVKSGNNLGTPNANLANQEASKFYKFLMQNGFHVSESRPWAAVIWGPVHSATNPTDIDHSLHLHVSLGKRRA